MRGKAQQYTRKRDNQPTEHAEQCALVRWWQLCAKPDLEPLLFAIPNGGARNPVTGAMLKAEGTRAGTPDLLLAIPRHGFGGLWLELKRRHGGRLSEPQKQMLGALSSIGYAVAVCHGFDEARRAICQYLGWESVKANQTARWKQPWVNWGNGGEE